MKKILLTCFAIIVSLFAFSQKLITKTVQVRDSIYINGHWVKAVTVDTSLISSAGDNEVPSTKAMHDFVQAKAIAGGATDTIPLHNQIIKKIDSVSRSNDSVFVWKNGVKIYVFKDSTGGSTVDTIPLHNQISALQTAKLNVSDTINKWINNLRRRVGTDTVEQFKNGTWQFAYKDSIGGATIDTAGVYNLIGEKINKGFLDIQREMTFINNKKYNGLPFVTTSESSDSVFAVWRSSNDHISIDTILYVASGNGFGTQPPVQIVTVDGNVLKASITGIGVGNNDRKLITWNYAATLDTVYFAKSDKNGSAFTSTGFVKAPANYDWIFLFGALKRLNGDTLIWPGYGQEHDTTAGRTSAILFISYDNGDTWQFWKTFIHGGNITIANGQKFPIAPSETGIEIIDRGTSVSTCKLVSMSRDDINVGSHIQCYSNDGGATWTNLLVTQNRFAFGTTNTGVVVNSYPCMLKKIDNDMYAIMGIRNDTAHGGFSIRMWKAPASTVYNNSNNWGNYTIKYRALDKLKYQDNDWSYVWPFSTAVGQIKGLFYDAAANGVVSGLLLKSIVPKVIPLTGTNEFERCNFSNQSVPNNTETAVSFPDEWIDAEGYYNSDSSKIYIASEGLYRFDVDVQFDTSSLGTFRQANLYMVDWGSQYGTTSAFAKYLITTAAIPTSTNSLFNTIHLSGQMYCWHDMEIRVTVKQDTGGSLNLVSNAYSLNALPHTVIRFKKIN